MLIALLWLEVMDKEWPLLWVLVVFFAGGAVGFFASRKWRWAAFVFSPLLALLGWVQLAELWDPSVGPAIQQEAGNTYVIWSYISIVSGIVFPIMGAISQTKRREKDEAHQSV